MNNMEDKNLPEDFEVVDVRIGKIMVLLLVLSMFGVILMSYTAGGMSEEETQIVEDKKIADIKAETSKNSPPKDYTGKLSPVLNYTINGAVEGKWAHFSFSQGREFYADKVDNSSLDWDIAISRARIVSNGGKTNPNAKGAIAVVPGESLDVVKTVPSIGFQTDSGASNPSETVNQNLDKWYAYDFMKHTLTPKKDIYVIRTADGHHAKLKLISYYCGEAVGCYTFQYVYNGRDSTSFE